MNSKSTTMKKIFLLLFVSILLLGCSSPEKRAHKLIQAELKKTMNDFESYEPIEFSKIDTAFLAYQYTKEYLSKYDSAEKIRELSSQIIGDRSIDPEIRLRMYDSIRGDYELKMKILKWSENMPSDIQEGWSIKHSYRQNNEQGAKVLSESVFYFTIGLDTIYKIEHVK